jgi:hypothetical protein
MCGGPTFTTGGDSGTSSGGTPDGGSGSGGGADGSSGGHTDASADTGPSSSSSSGGTGDAGSVDGGPWSPADLPGLSVWLDGDKGVEIISTSTGPAISRWQDQSGHVNDGVPTNTATGVNFGVDTGVLNGHDAVVCPGNGSWLNISDGPTVQFGTGDFGIVAVGKYFVDEYVWGKMDPATTGPGLQFGLSGGNYVLVAESGAKALLAQTTPNSFHIVAARGALFRIVADLQAVQSQLNTSDLSYPSGAVHICQTPSASAVPNELAELIVVKGTLSDADLTRTTTYLKNRFKL